MKKGEKMSVRKLISLLLLTAFSLTTITPAQAALTFNSSVVYPTIAQDSGNASDGANRDAVPVTFKFSIGSTADLLFGTAPMTTENGGFIIGEDGLITVPATKNGSVAEQRVAIFVPPTGTKFVRLHNGPDNTYIYNGTTGTAVVRGVDVSNNGDNLKNVSLNTGTTAALPASGGYIFASIIEASNGANIATFGTGADSEFPQGTLVMNFLSNLSTNAAFSSAGGTIELNGIGLAADPGTSLDGTTDLTVTYKEPNASSTASEAFSGDSAMTDGLTIKIAEQTTSVGKVEFIESGDITGSETSSTADDTQPNTILATQISGTTVNVKPGNITSTGTSLTTANLDVDATVLRAAERPDSTSSARTYFETPFATSAFTTTDGGATGSTNILVADDDIADLIGYGLEGNSTNFPNVTNALMKVVYTLETPAGSSSTATLQLDAATVSLIGPRAYTEYRNAGATAGGETTPLASGASDNTRRGYLGAATYGENGDLISGAGTSNTEDPTVGIAVLYDEKAAATDFPIVDTAPMDLTVQSTDSGRADSAANNSAQQTAAAVLTSATADPFNGGISIFPGTLVIDANGAAGAAALTANVVSVANGSGSSPFSFNVGAEAGLEVGDRAFGFSEVSARHVRNTSGDNNAYFIVHGSEATGDNSAQASIEIGSTNRSNGDLYHFSYDAKASAGDQSGAGVTAQNNVIMVSRLDTTSNEVEILPVTNKIDGIRDAILVRPEITVTLDDTAKSTGVRIIATATGGNLPSGGQRLVIGEIISSGGFTTNLDVTANAIPTYGDTNVPRLLRESSTDAGANRGSVELDSITGASTSADELSDLFGTGNVLDETLPPLFCGGTAGTSTRGPNGTVYQTKGRAVLITENGSSDFQDIADLGSNYVIRTLLPEGWDINKYATDGTNTSNGLILALEDTAGITTTIDRVQGVTSAVTQAFVDFSVSVNTGLTVNPTDAAALFFKPNALVVPANATNFSATIQLINNFGTSSTTDDTVVGTLGSVAMGTQCDTLLDIAYCDDAFSSFVGDSATFRADENGRELIRGSIKTTFSSAPSSAVRLISSSPSDVTLPDLCVTEGVADALPVGTINDGVPDQFGENAISNTGDIFLNLVTNFSENTTVGQVGFNRAISDESIFFSDTSLTQVSGSGALVSDGTGSISALITAIDGDDATEDNNWVEVRLSEGTISGRERPFEEMTTIRIPSGQLTLDAGAASQPVSTQSIIGFLTAPSANNSVYVVGSNTPIGQENVNTSTNEHALLNVFDSSGASDEDEGMSNLFSDKAIGTFTGTVVVTDWSDDETTSAINNISVAENGGNLDQLASAVSSVLDNSAYTLLDADTEISLVVDNGQVTLSGQAGGLEPGSLITVTNSGSGDSDSVVVPVLDDGSFKGIVKCGTSQTVNVTQAPTSGQTGALQVRTFDCDESLNADPEIASATADDIGLGTITQKGNIPVVFTVAAQGVLDGQSFTPTASQITLGGNPVTAVTGTTDKFIGLANFNTSTGTTVEVIAGGVTSTATLSGLDTATPTLNGRPKLNRVRENKNGFTVLRGTKLRKSGTFGYVLDDGTASLVDLRNPTRADRSRNRRRSSGVASVPTNAVYAFFHVSGRGVDSVEL